MKYKLENIYFPRGCASKTQPIISIGNQLARINKFAVNKFDLVNKHVLWGEAEDGTIAFCFSPAGRKIYLHKDYGYCFVSHPYRHDQAKWGKYLIKQEQDFFVLEKVLKAETKNEK